jgi:hypothetical protein
MSDGACVQLLGLLLDIVGVGLFSCGEIAGMAGLLPVRSHSEPTLRGDLRQQPRYRQTPLQLALRDRRVDVTRFDSPLIHTFPPKFWGLVMIMLGFLLQAMAVLGGP